MNIIIISNLIIPIMIMMVVLHGFYKKVSVYDTFISGAKEGVDLVISIFPYLLGMMLAINLMVGSGLLDALVKLLKPLFNIFLVPAEILPVAIFRPISGNASLAILNDVLKTSGPDSFIGTLASVLQGTTDTTIYILALYFGSIGIKKIRHALWLGLLVDLIGIISAIIIVSLMF